MTDNSKLVLLKTAIDIAEDWNTAKEYAAFIIGKSEPEVLKPIVVDRVVTVKSPIENGVYIVYLDGKAVRYVSDMEIEKPNLVKGIGVAHDGHAFVVSLKDAGYCPLLNSDDEEGEDYQPIYYEREVDALQDWDCKGNTEKILARGTEIKLKDGEYIPTLAQLALIGYHIKAINEALKSVGGEPLVTDPDDDPYYWSSTEYSATAAWTLPLNAGPLTIWDNKSKLKIHVRPVSAFL